MKEKCEYCDEIKEDDAPTWINGRVACQKCWWVEHEKNKRAHTSFKRSTLSGRFRK